MIYGTVVSLPRVTLINFNRAFYFTLSVDAAKIDARVASTTPSPARDHRPQYIRMLSVITVARAY